MRIGFYLQNKSIKDVDCHSPQNGNPGIGGTEYLFIAIPYALLSSSSNHEILLIANSTAKLPENLKTLEVANDNDFLQDESVGCLDYLVLRYSPHNYELAKRLPHNVKIIMWAHNFIKRSELTSLAKCEKVACIVCVGSEQLNMYRDHRAFYKSVAIFNAYPVKHFIESHLNEIKPYNSRHHEVTYLGNLVDYKGFHLLAQSWKKILKKVPDAHLNVIGGGKLYDRTQKLGRWGLAEQSYEDFFMPYLLDEAGRILPSVKFHGVMGNEKKEILNLTKVGVPNPSGVSETFCIAALEMQLWGAKIVTINYGGFKDTVRWGNLYDCTDKIADCIVKALLDESDEYSRAIEEIKQFDFSTISKDWITLFNALESDSGLPEILKPSCVGHKWKEINRKLKKKLPFGSFLPSSMFYSSIVNRIIRR